MRKIGMIVSPGFQVMAFTALSYVAPVMARDLHFSPVLLSLSLNCPAS